MPRVSIGLPVYNGERFLEESLNSLLQQTFQDFEVIISDNASTDRTQDICNVFAAKDSRIRYYRNDQNLGAALNYNKVFDLATGELFKWASHDDLCAPNYIERCVAILDQCPSVVLAYPRTLIIDEHGQVLKRYYDKLDIMLPTPHERFENYMLRSEGRECNAVFGVIRKSALARTPLIGNYNRSDQILLGYLTLLGQFYEIPEELFFRRDHPGTSSRANPSANDVAVWFDPMKKGKLILPVWRASYEYTFCVLRGRISVTERLRCLRTLGKWLWWHKPYLQREFWVFVKFFILRQKAYRNHRCR